MPIDKLIGMKAFSLQRILDFEPDFLQGDDEHQHDSTVSSCSCKFEGELNVNMLEAWIGEIITTKASVLSSNITF